MMDFIELFTKAILEKEEDIKRSVITKFMLHIKSYDFIEQVKMEKNSLKITLKEQVVESDSIVIKTFIEGGTLRKKSSSGKDKVDKDDYFYIEAF